MNVNERHVKGKSNSVTKNEREQIDLVHKYYSSNPETKCAWRKHNAYKVYSQENTTAEKREILTTRLNLPKIPNI